MAPPTKRANSDGIPVRQFGGELIAHVGIELADRLLQSGAAESFRNGSRRYLRLDQGINIPRGQRGWGVIEFLRRLLGDKRAAGYVAHIDRQSERLVYQPTSSVPERLRSAPSVKRLPASDPEWQVSEPKAPHDKGAK